MAKEKVVSVDKPSGSLALMYGAVRIDVSYKPIFDTLSSHRIQRSNFCEEHGEKLKQAWWCEEGEHYLRYDQSTKMADYEGQKIPVSDAELDKLKQPSDGVIELKSMLDYLDPLYVQKSYAMWPADKTWARSYKLLHQLLSLQDGVLLGMMVDEGTPRVIAVRVIEIVPGMEIMVGHLCHHAITLRTKMGMDIAEAVSEIPVPQTEELDLALKVFDTLPSDFDLDAYVDELGIAEQRFLAAKAAGAIYERGVVVIEEPPDLMEAMRQTLAERSSRAQQRAEEIAVEEEVMQAQDDSIH